MRQSIPPRPSGSNREATFAQWVWDSIHQLTIRDSEDVTVKRDSRGVYLQSKAKGGGISSPASILYFSDFNVSQAYKKNSIVRVRSGNYPLGLWIAVRDVPANNPPIFPEPHDVNPAVQNYWELLCLGVKQFTGCRGTTTVTVYVNMLQV